MLPDSVLNIIILHSMLHRTVNIIIIVYSDIWCGNLRFVHTIDIIYANIGQTKDVRMETIENIFLL